MREHEKLAHVYWIGGGSGAGKSTISRHLADRYGLRLYSTDDAMRSHASRCAPRDCPSLETFKAMTMDERWVDRPPREMLETFHWFRGEGFELIVDDLRDMASEGPVIAEGFRLLPDRVEPFLDERCRAVWLLPTPAFRVTAFESRGTLRDIADRTGDPGTALANLLERDRLFTERVREEVERRHLATIPVDHTIDETTLTDRVAARFGLGSHE